MQVEITLVTAKCIDHRQHIPRRLLVQGRMISCISPIWYIAEYRVLLLFDG